jgi:hypothetical protein
VCPECGKKLLVTVAADSIAGALATGESISLNADCHEKTWQASGDEREPLREYLRVAVHSKWEGFRLRG